MKKVIYLVMCENRVRGSEQSFENPYVVLAEEDLQDAKKDINRWNNQDKDEQGYLENHYFIKEIHYYTKEK